MTESHEDGDLDVLLEYLKRTRGFDFTGYKRANISRRVQKRMQAVRIPSYADYVDYLEVHPDEFVSLFNTILINVTAFFRDPEHWDYLRGEIIPRMVREKGPTEPIRVWVPGCATGEEAFSIAMALAEEVGLERYRESVKIYATDADEEALAKARQAAYTTKEIAGIPEDLAEKYLEPNGHIRTIVKELRRGVVFGRHNLISDAPISRADLISCRNTLMYFNADTQASILARFRYALNEGGFLFVGKAEMLFTHGNTFVPVDLRRRIFMKVPRSGVRERLLLGEGGDREMNGRVGTLVRLREAAFDTCPIAQMIVDAEGNVTMINELARRILGLLPRDIGRPLQDLEISYRPVELRSLIEQAHAEGRTITRADVDLSLRGSSSLVVDIEVIPLGDPEGIRLGTAVTFQDVTRYKRLQYELQDANQELEAAYEELQSTSEELETTNEELQSTVEELETTNEELQSTNEELETMNEELQSTNEELQTINDELRQRSEELNQANQFVGHVLSSLRGGVIVLDQDLHVRMWNGESEELWGLRSSEVQGKNFLNLGIGLPLEQLQQPIRAAMAPRTSPGRDGSDGSDGPAGDHRAERDGFERFQLRAINRRGKCIDCEVSVTPLRGDDDAVSGVILIVEHS